MKIVAKPHPVGAQPFPVVMPANCQYPWCTHREFTTDGSEVAVHARVILSSGTTPSVTGNMHVSHTELYSRYGKREPEWHDDGLDEYGSFPQPMEVHSIADAGLKEILNMVPTDTIYVSNVEAIIKRLDIGEALVIKRAGGSAHRTRVNIWRRMP